MIYLDNSATTRPCREAVSAMVEALEQNWGNPSALYDFGIEAARLLRAARHTVAAAMGAEPDRIFFTSGGTEADNWAVFGTVKRLGKRGRHIFSYSFHILSARHSPPFFIELAPQVGEILG